jgi:hypothetical protein
MSEEALRRDEVDLNQIHMLRHVNLDSVKGLLDKKEGVTKLRGNWFRWRDIPVMVTYHPSYLLRPYNQSAKREAWEDLKKVLHYVYDTPRDLLVWDIGAQAYPHKILTGRRDRFPTLRQEQGLSGFTRRDESPYDPFGAAHAGTPSPRRWRN